MEPRTLPPCALFSTELRTRLSGFESLARPSSRDALYEVAKRRLLHDRIWSNGAPADVARPWEFNGIQLFVRNTHKRSQSENPLIIPFVFFNADDDPLASRFSPAAVRTNGQFAVPCRHEDSLGQPFSWVDF